jgi:hypothetical protein
MEFSFGSLAVCGCPAPWPLSSRHGVQLHVLGLSGMAVLGLFILAVSVVVLRTRALGRWLGYVGAVVMIAAVVAQYGAFTTPLGILWALCLAVAIWRQPDPA